MSENIRTIDEMLESAETNLVANRKVSYDAMRIALQGARQLLEGINDKDAMSFVISDEFSSYLVEHGIVDESEIRNIVTSIRDSFA